MSSETGKKKRTYEKLLQLTRLLWRREEYHEENPKILMIDFKEATHHLSGL